jgi:hypothetical protein
VLDAADLETNVLEFVRKSFAFSQFADVAGREVAVFHRTETESESQFRPRILHLHLAVPREWVILDPAGEMLVLARDGRTVGLRTVGEAVEAAAEASEFAEQGIDFHRLPMKDRAWLYVPEEFRTAWTTPAGLAAIGVTPP